MAIPSVAANAYASLARITDAQGLAKGATGAVTGDGSGGPSFGTMLKDAIGALNQTTHASDMKSQAMAAGKANLVDVVTAVSETEVAIDALVSVSDKVISAYEEIMKMPI
ncbi:MAG: flagellar hook-basal body complex protein FliE [Bradyrhizobium sp.]